MGTFLVCAFLTLPAAAQTSLGSVNLGGSKTSAVTVTVPSGGSLSSISVVTQGAPNLDFTDAGGGTCAVGSSFSSCTVNVTFTPKYAGARSGAVVLSDANGVVGTAYLQGTGLGPQVVFPNSNESLVPASLMGLPYAVAVDGSYNVYIGDTGSTTLGANPGAARLLKETISSGAYSQSVIVSGLYYIWTVSLDAAGNVYVLATVLNSGNTELVFYKYTPFNGQYIQTEINWGGTLSPSIVVDAFGNLYFLSSGGLYTVPLQPDGSYGNSVTLPLPTPGYGTLGGMSSLVVDGNRNVFFSANVTSVDPYNVNIQETNSEIFEEVLSGGVYTPIELGISSAEVINSTSAPNLGIFSDASGNLYVYPLDGDITAMQGYSYESTGYLEPAWSYLVLYGYLGTQPLAVDASGSVYLTNTAPFGSSVPSAGVYKLDYSNPPTVSFSASTEGVTSMDSPKMQLIANYGNSPLIFSDLSYPVDFPQASGVTGDCTSTTSLSSGASCSLYIDFTPVSPIGSNTSEVLTESVDITTNTLNASATKQSITVTGTEIDPPAATPTFSILGGTYTSMQTVLLSDTTTGASIYYTTDGVTTPTINSTKYTGAITVSATETIQAIAMASGYSASAVASATYTITPGFTITGKPVTVTAGATSGNTSAITLTPVGGFTGSVALTSAITTGPSGGVQPTLSFGSTTPANITGSAAGTATLTITTTASSTTQCTSENRTQQGIPWYSGGGAVLACVLLFGIPERRRGWLKMLGLSLLLVALAGGATACGGGGGTACAPIVKVGTMPGNYTITITGTSNSITSTGTVNLTVQ
ncbi:MAG: chitobiase/beta-hexosaminidase C-terminal domain-containing protein [Terracidiphilus sp.]